MSLRRSVALNILFLRDERGRARGPRVHVRNGTRTCAFCLRHQSGLLCHRQTIHPQEYPTRFSVMAVNQVRALAQ